MGPETVLRALEEQLETRAAPVILVTSALGIGVHVSSPPGQLCSFHWV